MPSKLRSLSVALFLLALAVPAFSATPAPSRAPDAGERRATAESPTRASSRPAVLTNCVTNLPCSAGDFDGSGSLGGADLGMWLHVFFSGAPFPAGYDLDGADGVNANDLAIWLCLYFNC